MTCLRPACSTQILSGAPGLEMLVVPCWPACRRPWVWSATWLPKQTNAPVLFSCVGSGRVSLGNNHSANTMCYACNTCMYVWVFACMCVNVNMCGSWKSIVGISLHCGGRISLETRVHQYGCLTSQFAVGAHHHLPGAGITGEPSTWHVHGLWRSELQSSHLKGKCIKFHEDTVHQ